jgi:hypothetical protein
VVGDGGYVGEPALLQDVDRRAITRPRIASDMNACTAMASLTQRASGMTSVGLNAVAAVKPRYR